MKNQQLLPPVGTKVYHFEHGWGTIDNIDKLNPNYPLDIKFKGIDDSFTEDGRDSTGDNIPTLSLTEYDLINGGFTPISDWNKPKVGDMGYFWDDENWDNLVYSSLTKVNKSVDFPYESLSGVIFKNFSPEVPDWYKKKIEEIKSNLASPCTQEQKEK